MPLGQLLIDNTLLDPAQLDEARLHQKTAGGSLIESLVTLGLISTEECLARSITGPILRSTGFAWDLRKAQPYLAYDQVDFDVMFGANGDVFDRYRLRLSEIHESMKIVRQCVERIRPLPCGRHTRFLQTVWERLP